MKEKKGKKNHNDLTFKSDFKGMCGSLLFKFRKRNGDQTKLLETRSLESSHQSKNLLKDAISSQCEANAVRALDHSKPVLPAINSTSVAPPLAARNNSDHLMESAREILAIHGYAGRLQVATLRS